MSITARWGLIGLVATTTSFTVYYSLYNPKDPFGTTIYLGIGIFLFMFCVFMSILSNKRANPQEFTVKKGLQEGMKTALMTIVLFSIYNYFYLSSFNTEVVARLMEAQIDVINATGQTDAMKQQQIANLPSLISPFKKMTQDILKFTSIASMTSILGTVIAKKFPI